MNSVSQASDQPATRRKSNGLMSRKEAAVYLGVAEITLAIWRSTGRYNLPVYKIGRLAKYKESDLDAFIASRLVPDSGRPGHMQN